MTARQGRAGRPPSCSMDLAMRVIDLRWTEGLSYSKMADRLNDEGWKTPGGCERWTKSIVDDLVHTAHIRELRAECKDQVDRR